MKHRSPREAVLEALADQSETAALPLSPARLAKLADYAIWTAPAASRLGLTRYADPLEFTQSLICPTLSLLTPPLQSFLGSPALDFGTGSGAVGFSLGMMRPDIEVVLADRRARVVQFADLCQARMQLPNCHSMLVDLARPPCAEVDGFALVLLRAFAPGPQALEMAAQWAHDSGCIALWHQPPAPPAPPGFHRAMTAPTCVTALELTIYAGLTE